ncbi:MAG: division/cell wall cluster transcriptional repressor MraZ [Pseudomonadota bacterium]
MVRAFRGDFHQKVDGKGRVSIPAQFRRVLEEGDPNWETGKLPEFVLVYGDEKRAFLEGFTLKGIARVDRMIAKMPRGSAKRRALSRLYSGQSVTLTIDDTGRIVLPSKLRGKIGLDAEAYFIGNTDTFEIWSPSGFDAAEGIDGDEEGYDPDADASIYLPADDEDEDE